MPKGSVEYSDLVHSHIPHETVVLLHLPSSADKRNKILHETRAANLPAKYM
jgi:hypothetical protein